MANQESWSVIFPSKDSGGPPNNAYLRWRIPKIRVVEMKRYLKKHPQNLEAYVSRS